MERSEKALVPEWLKIANGGTNGGGASTPHISASSSQSDRATSGYLCRSLSGNGYVIHDKDSKGLARPFRSFGRNQRDRSLEKDYDFWFGDCDISDSLTLTSWIKKDKLMHSQSMTSGKQSEVWPRRVGHDISNGLLVGGNIMSNIHKAAFEKDFPSLDAETKHSIPNIGRISSPGLSAASQNLPIANYAAIGGEGWTSALAQLPVSVGSSSTSTLSSFQQASPTSIACVAPTTASRNMAEALVQTPARTCTTPQLAAGTQRLEELAIKQSRQLIPMTPSMPKTSVLNSSEKLKSRIVRSCESSTVTKVVQQPFSSQFVNHAVHGITRSDISKPTQSGNLTVLKATHEKNDSSCSAEDGHSVTNASRVLHGVVQSSASAPLRSLNSPKLPTDSKAAVLSVTQNSVDRRTFSQSQKRIDFFNSLRKKTSANHSGAVSDSIPTASSVSEKSNDQTTAIAGSVSKDAPASGPDSEWLPGSSNDAAGIGDACEESKADSSSDDVLLPDEEEAAFLRSLGWEENAEAAAPLTEEEINAFSELLRSRPSTKQTQGVQQSRTLPFESHVGSLGGTSSILSSSDSEAEA